MQPPSNGQAETPALASCAVYVVVVLFILAVAVFVLVKSVGG